LDLLKMVGITLYRPMEKKYTSIGWRIRLLLEEKKLKYETRLVVLTQVCPSHSFCVCVCVRVSLSLFLRVCVCALDLIAILQREHNCSHKFIFCCVSMTHLFTLNHKYVHLQHTCGCIV